MGKGRMGWGGVIAGALASGVAGAMSSMARTFDETHKEQMAMARETRLAELRRQNQAIMDRDKAQLDLEMVGPKAQAQAEAQAAIAPTLRDISVADMKAKAAAENENANTFSKDKNARRLEELRDVGPAEAEYAAAVAKAKETDAERRYRMAQAANLDARTAAGYESPEDRAARRGGGGSEKKSDKVERDPKPYNEKYEDAGEGVKVDHKTQVLMVTQKYKPARDGRPEQPAGVIYKDANTGAKLTRDEVERRQSEYQEKNSSAGMAATANFAATKGGTQVPDLETLKAERDAALRRRPDMAAQINARFKQLTEKKR